MAQVKARQKRGSEESVMQAGDQRGASLDVAALRGRATCGIEEAAELLGIGRSTAYAAARDGSLPTVRLSHRLLVPTAKLLALLGVEPQREE